jgi:hypothetical protein
VCWIDGDVQLASIDACLLGDKVWLAGARKWCPAVTGQNDFPLNSFRSQTKKKEIIFFSFPSRGHLGLGFVFSAMDSSSEVPAERPSSQSDHGVIAQG